MLGTRDGESKNLVAQPDCCAYCKTNPLCSLQYNDTLRNVDVSVLKKLLVISGSSLQPNFLTLQSMILMQRNLLVITGARCNRTRCMRDPVYNCRIAQSETKKATVPERFTLVEPLP